MNVLIHNALIVSGEEAPFAGWLRTDGARIAQIGRGEYRDDRPRDCEVVDARGAMLLPGAIDCHVHFREPGLTHKATIASESAAAVAGGVTSYIDMPNCVPTTTTLAAWEDKMQRAEASSAANYGFMLGATSTNLAELQRADYSQVAAVKVFMGSSTGNMLLAEREALRAVFADQPGRVVVHAEDQNVINEVTARLRPILDASDISAHSRLRPVEACVAATERAMELAAHYGTRLHVAHITTAAETRLFDPADSPVGRQITGEVSPHHLLWCTDDYARLGARIKMNPAVKSAADREALREALRQGRLDIVATDHAPHLLSEKEGDVFHAVSGAPMVQFSLVSMLDLFEPTLVAHRMANCPAELFGIERRGYLREGYYADMTIVERLAEPYTITDADVCSLCGWTPLNGYATRHRVVRTWVNGGQGAQALAFLS
ncbi:MAG: amidohydrolase family protein [Muribaculaceae bacterium]